MNGIEMLTGHDLDSLARTIKTRKPGETDSDFRKRLELIITEVNKPTESKKLKMQMAKEVFIASAAYLNKDEMIGLDKTVDHCCDVAERIFNRFKG